MKIKSFNALADLFSFTTPTEPPTPIVAEVVAVDKPDYIVVPVTNGAPVMYTAEVQYWSATDKCYLHACYARDEMAAGALIAEFHRNDRYIGKK